MDYERAVAEALRGAKLMRSHWHWCYLSAREDNGKLCIFEEDHRMRGPYKPTRDDRKATDWVIVK